jgi:hypothetical protein
MSVKVDKPVKCVLCRKYRIPKMYNDGRYWDDKKKVAILPRRR